MKTLKNIIIAAVAIVSLASCSQHNKIVNDRADQMCNRTDQLLNARNQMIVRVQYNAGSNDFAFIAPLGTQIGDSLKDVNGNDVKVVRIVSGNRN